MRERELQGARIVWQRFGADAALMLVVPGTEEVDGDSHDEMMVYLDVERGGYRNALPPGAVNGDSGDGQVYETEEGAMVGAEWYWAARAVPDLMDAVIGDCLSEAESALADIRHYATLARAAGSAVREQYKDVGDPSDDDGEEG